MDYKTKEKLESVLFWGFVALACVFLVLTIYRTGQKYHEDLKRETTQNKMLVDLSKRVEKLEDLVEETFRQELSVDFTTYSIPVTVTAYSARAEECDATPWVTADGTPSRVGLLAVSRDLLDEIGLKMGQRVLLPDYGVFEIRDKMNKRFRRRVDILHADPESARLFGKRQTRIVWVGA